MYIKNNLILLLPSIVIFVVLYQRFIQNDLQKIAFAFAFLPCLTMSYAVYFSLLNYNIEFCYQFYINVTFAMFNILSMFTYFYLYDFYIYNKKIKILENEYLKFNGNCNICMEDNICCYKYKNNKFQASCKFCWFTTCENCFFRIYFGCDLCPQCKKINYEPSIFK